MPAKCKSDCVLRVPSSVPYNFQNTWAIKFIPSMISKGMRDIVGFFHNFRLSHFQTSKSTNITFSHSLTLKRNKFEKN